MSYARFNRSVICNAFNISLKKDWLSGYGFNESSYEFVDANYTMRIIDRKKFIDSSLQFLKIHGCFPTIVFKDINTKMIVYNNIDSNDVLWHDVMIENMNGDISRMFGYVDSIIVQRNGKRIMNSVKVSESFYFKRYNDTELVRTIAKSISDSIGNHHDYSSEICDYLDDASMSNIAYIFDIDKSYKSMLLLINKEIRIVKYQTDFMDMTRYIMNLLIMDSSALENIRFLAYSNDTIGVGSWRIGDIGTYDIKSSKDIIRLVAYLKKKLNSAIEMRKE